MAFKMKGSPMQRNFGIGREARLKRQGEKGDANELVAKRTKLKEKKEKREAKGKNTKFLDNRIDKNQTRIDHNPTAIGWSKNKKTKKQTFDDGVPIDSVGDTNLDDYDLGGPRGNGPEPGY